jgi:16S rRNA U516 pseudouridylate synthase RsuA-like enzyme
MSLVFRFVEGNSGFSSAALLSAKWLRLFLTEGKIHTVREILSNPRWFG